MQEIFADLLSELDALLIRMKHQSTLRKVFLILVLKAVTLYLQASIYDFLNQQLRPPVLLTVLSA
jgi:hypothetical protein